MIKENMRLKRAISSVLSAKSEKDIAVCLEEGCTNTDTLSRLMPRWFMMEEEVRCHTEMLVIIQEIWTARAVLPGMSSYGRRL